MTEKKTFDINIPELPDPLIPVIKPVFGKDPNNYIWNSMKSAICKRVIELVPENQPKIVLTEPPNGLNSDFGYACHPLAKLLRKSPVMIADEFKEAINRSKIDQIEDISAVQGYLNFKIETDGFGNKVLQDIEEMGPSYGQINTGNEKVVVFDCSSPNIAKYMSVGHLRSTVIGEALARIYQAGGYTVIRDNHLGDWGTQFGMLGRAYELWKDEIPDLGEDGDSVKGLYQLYVKMHDEIEKQGEDSSLAKEGKEWFKKLESGDPSAQKLLEWSTKSSLKEFQRVYDLLGSNYEYMLGESFYVGMLPELIQTMLDKNIAQVDETGAVFVDLEKEDLGKFVIQKNDGASLYSTRDLATLVARTEWFDPEKIIYVVGGDQKNYFRRVFSTFGKMVENPPKLEHVSFGMISLPEGKMSTRKGRVIFLEDVLDEAVERARQKVKSPSKDSNKKVTEKNIPDEEIDDIAKKVGVGSVIYFDLGQSRERNIKFEWEEALSLEGNSAPYIQYTNARAEAVLKKAAEQAININQAKEATFSLPSERSLVKHLSRLPEAIIKALEQNEPSVIAAYLYSAADLFNKFYQEAPIIAEPDIQKQNTRLRLAAAASQVIQNGLNLLSIEAPRRM